MTEKQKRGFAAMSPEAQRAIASKGGKSAHAQGVAHEFSSEEAKIAGRKGGLVISKNKKHMSEIGKLGGRGKSDKD
jgi:general stress protein YciG